MSSDLSNRLKQVEKAFSKQNQVYDYNGGDWKIARLIYGEDVAKKVYELTPYRPLSLLNKHELMVLTGNDITEEYDDVFKAVFQNTPEFWQKRLAEREVA